MKDFHVVIRLKNNQLLERRERLGVTQKMFADFCSIAKTVYAAFECLRESPINSKGEWKEAALRIAAFYEVLPEVLWPEMVCNVKKPLVTRKCDAEEMSILNGEFSERASLPPSDHCLEAEKNEVVRESLNSCGLKNRDQKILEMVHGLNGFEEHTFTAVAKILKISTSRVQQIYYKSLRIMRHKKTRNQLMEVDTP
jgi:hypothetical protein